MNSSILKKIKTKLLLREEYIDIIKNKLGYSDVYLVNVNRLKIYSEYPKKSLEYIYNQEVHNVYELMVDNDTTIYLYESKKGIHLNGDFDYREVMITDSDGLNLYSNLEQNDSKKKINKR